jgi:arsenite methyltransferase
MSYCLSGQELIGSRILRPGGFKITDRAIEYCNFTGNAKLADIGCGYGDAVKHIQEKYHLDVCGIEPSGALFANGGKNQELALIQASAEKMPFLEHVLDAVIFECSFSLVEDSQAVLSEVRRVLKTNGFLIISDMYARGGRAILSGLLRRIETKEDLIGQVVHNNFDIRLFEDYTTELKSMIGQIILDSKRDALYRAIGACSEELRSIKCGYFLLIAQKRGER